MKKLTDSDYDMVNYFHFEKGDITRWIEWEEKKPLFEEKHPELLDAIKRKEIAEKTLDIIIRNLSYEV